MLLTLYMLLFVIVPFCLFVFVFHNDHNSNSRCPFLHCWHAINTSSSAHLSSYLFLFFLALSLLIPFSSSYLFSFLISLFSLCFIVSLFVCNDRNSHVFFCPTLFFSDVILLWAFYKKAEYGKSWWGLTLYFCAFQYFFVKLGQNDNMFG